MKNDSTKLELSFTTKQISYLAHTSCKSFVQEQVGRFEFYSSPEQIKLMDSGWLHWIDNNSYLSALIMQQFCIARGYRALIIGDLGNEEIDPSVQAEWVVWTDDPLDMEETS